MRFQRQRGSTSNIVEVFIPDNTSVKGAGLTGLTNASTNLVIAYKRELDSAFTTYSGANIETITTIGTFANPSASSKVRFKAVDATNAPGLYQIMFHDSATIFGTGDASQAVIINVLETTTSALNIGPNMVLIPLVPWNPQDGVRQGLTALPNAAAEAAGGLFTRGTGAGQINQAANGQIDANAVAVSGDSTAADNLEAACDGTTYNIGGGAVVAASVTGAVGSVTGAVGSVTGAVGSVSGAVGSVTGDVGGKVLGGGGSTISGTGARVVDASGNNVAPASTALTNATWTDAKAGYLDAAISGRSTLTAQQVWEYATRTLSAFGFTVTLASGQLTVKKNVALSDFAFPMFDATGALKSGLTVAVSLRKDAGAFAGSSNPASEIGSSGWYTLDLTQAEMNADVIAFSATAVGANPTAYTIITQA